MTVQPVGAHRRGVAGAHRVGRRTGPHRWLLTTIITLATVAALAAVVALVAALLTPSEAPRRNQAAGGGGVPQGVPASSSGIRIHSTG